jgi:hypothetical protein
MRFLSLLTVLTLLLALAPGAEALPGFGNRNRPRLQHRSKRFGKPKKQKQFKARWGTPH